MQFNFMIFSLKFQILFFDNGRNTYMLSPKKEVTIIQFQSLKINFQLQINVNIMYDDVVYIFESIRTDFYEYEF